MKKLNINVGAKVTHKIYGFGIVVKPRIIQPQQDEVPVKFGNVNVIIVKINELKQSHPQQIT